VRYRSAWMSAPYPERSCSECNEQPGRILPRTPSVISAHQLPSVHHHVASGHATLATKRALPLLGPDFHRLDRTSLRLAHSLDHLVGAQLQRIRHFKAERASRLQLMTNSNLVYCSTGRSAGFAPLRICPM